MNFYRPFELLNTFDFCNTSKTSKPELRNEEVKEIKEKKVIKITKKIQHKLDGIKRYYDKLKSHLKPNYHAHQ